MPQRSVGEECPEVGQGSFVELEDEEEGDSVAYEDDD